MGLFDYLPWGSYWRGPQIPVEEDAPRTLDKAPKEKPPARRHSNAGYLLSGAGLVPVSYGGNGQGYVSGQAKDYGCTWPWQRLWAGDPLTYEWMLCHPKLAHSYSQIVNGILNVDWDLDVSDGTPEQQPQLIRDMMFPLRRPFFELSLLGVPFGCAGAQNLWTIRDGTNWIKGFNQLPIHRAGNILEDKTTGELIGIRWSDSGGKQQDYIGAEAWVYTHQRYRSATRYGLSRFENLRTQAWQPWLETWGKLARTLHKLSGKYVYAKVPDGSFVDANGQDITYQEDMRRGLMGLDEDIGLIVTNLALTEGEEDKLVQAKLSQGALVDVSALDFGSTSPAVQGILETLKYYDGLMSEGMMRSPRTSGSNDQKHGGRADAEQHTDNDALDSQLLAGDIDAQANEQLTDRILTLKFGEAYKPGSVRLKTKKIQDDTKSRANMLLQMIFTGQGTLAMALSKTLDIDKLIADAGYATVQEFGQSMEEQQQEQLAQQQAAAAQAQQQPQPGGNGAAKGNSRQQPAGGRMK